MDINTDYHLETSVKLDLQSAWERLKFASTYIKSVPENTLDPVKHQVQDLQANYVILSKACNKSKIQLKELQNSFALKRECLETKSKCETELKKVVKENHHMTVVKYKNTLDKLNMTLNCHFLGSTQLEFTYKQCCIVFQYSEDKQQITLVQMKPVLSIFNELRTLLNQSNDMIGLLCAWRKCIQTKLE